jgi:hypothetical protein
MTQIGADFFFIGVNLRNRRIPPRENLSLKNFEASCGH